MLLATCTGYMSHTWEDEVLLVLGIRGEGLRWILDYYIHFIQEGAQLVIPRLWWDKSYALAINL